MFWNENHFCTLTLHVFDWMFAFKTFLICLVDNVFEQILHSSSPELAEARKILQNIQRRNLYKCLGQTQPDKALTVTQVSVFLSFWNKYSYTYKSITFTSLRSNRGLLKRAELNELFMVDLQQFLGINSESCSSVSEYAKISLQLWNNN